MSQTIPIILTTTGGLLALVALAATLLVLRDRAGARRRIEALFRRPPKTPRTPGPGHYYKPYWS